jgi:lipoate-protein ligase A
MHDHTARFDRFGTLFVDAFRGLGIDASIGAVPGEYCPGAHSVNARHRIKLVGTAQRVIRDAWLFSALVVVDDSELLKPVLRQVYERLEQPFDPASVGSLAEEAPGLTVADAERAVLDALGAPDADESSGLEALASRARALLHHHLV